MGRRNKSARRYNYQSGLRPEDARYVSSNIVKPVGFFDRRFMGEPARRRRIEKHKIAQRKEFHKIQAPRRIARKARAHFIAATFGFETYHKLHNCKQEWRKLLSWRSGQGSGRKRTQNELRKNHLSFIKKDC